MHTGSPLCRKGARRLGALRLEGLSRCRAHDGVHLVAELEVVHELFESFLVNLHARNRHGARVLRGCRERALESGLWGAAAEAGCERGVQEFL